MLQNVSKLVKSVVLGKTPKFEAPQHQCELTDRFVHTGFDSNHISTQTQTTYHHHMSIIFGCTRHLKMLIFAIFKLFRSLRELIYKGNHNEIPKIIYVEATELIFC